MRTAVLIPCYNEAKSIQAVVEDFKANLPDADIYVYDNNSTDGTDEIARSAGAIVRYEARQGKGKAERKGKGREEEEGAFHGAVPGRGGSGGRQALHATVSFGKKSIARGRAAPPSRLLAGRRVAWPAPSGSRSARGGRRRTVYAN